MKKNLNFGLFHLVLILIIQFIYPSITFGKDNKSSLLKKLFNEHLTTGLNAGKSNYIGDINNNSYGENHFNKSISVFVSYQIRPVFGVPIQYVNGTIGTPSENDCNKSMNIKHWDYGYQVIVNSNNLISNYNANRFLNLYLFIGPSRVSYHSIVKKAEESRYRQTDGKTNELLVIFGAGAYIKLIRNLDFNIEYANHLSTSNDRLDFNEKLKKKDKFSYASLGLTYKVAGRDKDRDGMIDKRDRCHEILGKAELDGCLDKNNDGVSASEDHCPDIPGLMEFFRCTNSDMYGNADGQCPDKTRPFSNNGCPTPNEFLVNKVIYFKVGKTNVNPNYTKDLDEIAEMLKLNPDVNINIEGHTDSFVSESNNFLISVRRATLVMTIYLQKGSKKTG